MYNTYGVKLGFRDRLYGGLPRNPISVGDYVEKGLKADETLAQKIREEVDAQDWIEASMVGFRRDGVGLYLKDHQIKAMMKQAADLLGLTEAVSKGGMGGRAKEIMKEATYVKPCRVYLGRKEPDGTETFYGHVEAFPEGRSVVRMAEYVERAEIEFEVWTVDRGRVTFSEYNLRGVFEFGQELGLGSFRSFEAGKYDLLSFAALGRQVEFPRNTGLGVGRSGS